MDGQSLPMSKISDVFSGRHQPLFKSPAAKDYPSEQCFTLGSKNLPLNLVAESAADRTTWIGGIKEVFAAGQAAKKAEKAAAAAAAGGAGAAAASTNGAASNSAAAPASEATTAAATTAATSGAAAASAAPAAAPVAGGANMLTDGRAFKSVTLDASAAGGAIATDIFLWHDASEGKLGTLHYSITGDKSASAGKLPVAKIKDVMLGRQTPELKSDFAKQFTSTTCFSLMMDKEQGIGMHLVAKDDAERTETLATIKGFWGAQPKKAKAAATTAAAPAATTAAAATTTAEPANDHASNGNANGAAAAPAAAAAEPQKQPQQQETNAEPAYSAPVVRLHLGGTATDDEPKAAEPVKQPAPAPVAAAAAVTSPANAAAAAADKEAAAALSARVSAEPQVNIASMVEGCAFKRHTLDDSAGPGRDIFLFLVLTPEGGSKEMGSFFWNDGAAQNYARDPARQLPLGTIKDIFAGLHVYKKAKVALPTFPSSRGLSLVSPREALHLEAPSDEVRARWSVGIKNVFEASQRKTVTNPKSSPAGAAGAAAGSPTASHKDFMSVGGEFTTWFFNDDHSVLLNAPITLFYERSADRLGSIFWCQPGRRDMVSNQCIPMHKISDVTQGKHVSIKDRPELSNVRRSNMFTLASRNTSIHLEARDESQRAAWIGAIKTVFTSAGKKVDENRRGGPNIAEVPMSPHGLQGSSGAVSPHGLQGRHPLPVVATPIGEGVDFEALVFAPDGQSLKSYPVHLWFEKDDSKLGSLYWSNTPGLRHKVADQSLPLDAVTDVFVGRHVDEFRHPDAAGIPLDRCISLRSQTHPNQNLNLIAPTAQAQRRWVRGLKKQFSASPATVVETRSVRAGQYLPEAASSPRSARGIQAKLAVLAAGHDVVALENGGSQRAVTLWLDQSEGRAGTLRWSARGTRTKEEGASIGVHSLSEVYIGKKTAVFKQPAAAGIAANTAFSIANKNRQLNAFTSVAERSLIMDELEAAVRNAGTPIRTYTHRGVPQNAVVTNAGLLAQTAVLQQGTKTLWHATKGAQARPIFLWYEPQTQKQGCFYWTDVVAGKVSRDKQPGSQMLVQHISDVMTGRQSKILKASSLESGARSENCFSLYTTNGPALDLQMSSRSERDAWLNAVRAIFMQTQKRIVEGSGVASVSKLAVGAIVDTWYGRGTVLEPTRKADGITKIDIGGTTCFFNHDTIRPATVLYTPYGRGVAPADKALAAIRPDGIRRVELNWATAYLNAEAWSERDPKGSALPSLHQSRDQSVEYLSKGAQFLRITSRGDQELTFVSLNAAASAMGTLEFRSAQGGGLQGTVALKEISDLLVGCQTPPLRAQRHIREALAMSIVGKAVNVDLVAPNEQARSDWLYALFNLLSAAGRRITSSRATATGSPTSPNALAAVSPLAGAAARRYSFSKPQLPMFQEAEALLTRGNLFQMLIVRTDGTRESAPSALVFLDSATDCLYWWPTQEKPENVVWRTKYPSRSIPLALIRDCWYGKKTETFAERAFVGTPREQCFAIGTKDKTQWNFIAPDRDTRDRTFYAIQAILTSRERQSRLQSALQAPKISASSAAAWSPRTADSTAQTAGNVLVRGVVATRWVGSESPASEPVFVFHEFDGSKYGSLYWNAAEGDRSRASNRCFPLHTVRDVWQGKNTPALKALVSVPKDVLMALGANPPADGSAPLTLALQFASRQERAEFVTSLKEFWSGIKPTAASPRSPSSPSAAGASSSSSSSSSTAMVPVQPQIRVTGAPLSDDFKAALVAAAPRAFAVAPLPAVGLLQTGSTFTRNGSPIDAFYTAAAGFEAPFGSIYTAAPASREMKEEAQVAVHRIERVRVAQDGKSFTLQTSTASLQLDAQSPELVAAWLSGLQYVFAAAGFRVTQNAADGAFVINDPEPAAANLPATALALPESVSVAAVEQGAVFNALFPAYGAGAKKGSASRTPVFLFAEHNTLYVSAVGARSKDDEDEARRFPLAQLTRVSTGGKFGPLAAALQSRDNYMDIEASSQPELSLWLAGLSALVGRQGAQGTSIMQEREGCTESKRTYLLSARRVARRGPTQAGETPSAASSMDAAGAVSPASESAALAEFESSGATVEAYTLKGSALQHKSLSLWLGTDAASGLSTLNWGAPDDEFVLARLSDPEGDNVLEVDDILSAQVGKLTPVLLAVEDAVAAGARCVAITSGSGTKLDLVAASPAQAQAIVAAIKGRNPKSLVLKQ